MKRALLFLFTAALSAAAVAQRHHELSVFGGGGLSTLSYNPAVGSSAWGLGGQCGLGYAYHFSPRWGVVTGIGMSFHRASAALNGVALVTPDLHDHDGDPFALHATLAGHDELQQARYLNIPLQARFVAGRFYAQAGVSVGFPLAASYRTAAFTATTRGYYPPLDSWGGNEDERQGFGVYPGAAGSGALALKVSASAALEAGLRWAPARRWRLYTGLYLDYGLNNVNVASASAPFVPYDPQQPTAYRVNNVFSSPSPSPTASGQRLVDKVALLAAGVMLRLAFVWPKPATDTLLAATPLAGCRDTVWMVDTVVVTNTVLVKSVDTVFVTVREVVREAPEDICSKVRIERPINGYMVRGTQPSHLSAAAQVELDERAEFLKQCPEKHIVVEGYTCDLGTHAMNIYLGQQRADKVKNYLVQKGVAASRITTASKAEASPAAPNTSEENRRKNRRVEIRLVE
ncbi:MAG: OmpA family protein [Prevotellaceae bacterium]|jgi:hypothetical protein|nr:OmpA family protein [Prevotellaceae bacterium]